MQVLPYISTVILRGGVGKAKNGEITPETGIDSRVASDRFVVQGEPGRY
jgi:hypothetical protein